MKVSFHSFERETSQELRKRVHREEIRRASHLGWGWDLGMNDREQGLDPWLCLEAVRRNWMIGWGVRAGGCGDFLLRWQASWPGRSLENKGPRCGPEKGEKEMSW